MKTTEKPTLQDFYIDGVKHINPKDALHAVENGEAIIIDVREDDEIKLETIPLSNILYHPLSVFEDRLPYISKDQNIILVCPAGVRSSRAANILSKHGYPNVANLDGGLTIWKALGLPFESNLSSGGGGCGCGCSTTSTNSNDGGCC